MNSTADIGEDLIAAIVVNSIDPDDQDLCWIQLASKVYCAASIVLSPADVEAMYWKFLRTCGGFSAAKERAAAIATSDSRYWKFRQSVFEVETFAQKMVPSASPASIALKTDPFNAAAAPAASAVPAVKIEEKSSGVAPFDASVVGSGGTGTRLRELKDKQLPTTQLLDILSMFRAIEGFNVFEDTVAPRVVNTVMATSNYGSVIRSPVSVASIRAAIYAGTIRTGQALETAVWKMAANCAFFNVPEGPYPGLARRFASACSAIINREVGVQ